MDRALPHRSCLLDVLLPQVVLSLLPFRSQPEKSLFSAIVIPLYR